MAYTKRVIQGNSEKLNKKEFRAKKHPDKKDEQDIFIIFQTEVEHVIEKLSTDELPAIIDGKPVTWINNFWVKDTAGNYVNGVKYSVLLPPLPAGAQLVYHDGNKLSYFTGQIKDRVYNKKNLKEIEFSIGDPAIGWTGG
jgi:hypothetical protein